jgi:hypothetical protein
MTTSKGLDTVTMTITREIYPPHNGGREMAVWCLGCVSSYDA